ncbi:MAG: molecular chaperone TorD family protein [Chloroflexi bacterium]|nr:molecular chaperone TorD family protein [Chloroflexota bacterium]
MTAIKEATLRGALARAQAYGLLARAFGRPDAELESEVTSGRFGKALAEALAVLGAGAVAGLDAPPGDDDLGADFTRLFNPSLEANCPPYETEYTGAHVFMRAQQLADVAGFYRAFGVKIAATFHERPDHVAAELEFMQVLALKEARALARGERANAGICRRAQARFIKEHLGRWLAPYADRLAAANSGFYARLGALARSFVAWDADRLRVEPEIAGPLRVKEPQPEITCPDPAQGSSLLSGGEADVPR